MAQSLTRRNLRRLRLYVDGLNERLPADRPVTVARVRRTEGWGSGSCLQEKERYRIFIRADQTYVETLDSLCHEWAHALHWSTETDHPDEWGIMYARTYRAMSAISADWTSIPD